MRIIGGQWKGRRINVPSKNWPVRPTTDFAREALFNILDNRLVYEDISALDLFGGTGMHSVELVSRGCNDVTYVDRYKDSVRYMTSLAREWQMPINAVQSDALIFLQKSNRKWDYIFADPPYDYKHLEDLIVAVTNGEVLEEKGFFVLEHVSKIKFDNIPSFKEARNYGQTVFSFFAPGS
jgi:16S rRNA (guanine966-N2)-methyltransferase